MEKVTKRRYFKRKRAQDEERTRLAITEAVMDLHRTIGPARTTVTEVAERAGVSRMTVYNHFPTDADLVEACSAHWASLNPFPDPAGWRGVEDPDERLVRALRSLYGWYRETGDMMGNVLRDAPMVPPLDAILRERWWRYVGSVVEILMRGREAQGSRRREIRAAIRLALEFHTWRTLTGAGLSDDAASRVSAALPAAVSGRSGPRGRS